MFTFRVWVDLCFRIGAYHPNKRYGLGNKGQTHTKKTNTPNTFGFSPFVGDEFTFFFFFLLLLMLFLCVHTFLEWSCFAFSPSCLFYNIYPICFNASSICIYSRWCILFCLHRLQTRDSKCFMLLVDRLLFLPPSSSLSFPFAFKF